MKRGEHLPIVQVDLSGFLRVLCACGAKWEPGDYFDDRNRKGRTVRRRISSLALARRAHQLHYLSPEAASYCEHPEVQLVEAGRLVCTICGEPL